MPHTDHFGDVLAVCRRRRLAGGRDRLGARRCRHAVDPGAVSPCDRRPPDVERAPLRARGWGDRRAERGDRVGSRARRARCSPIPPGSPRCAPRCWAWRASTRPTGSQRGSSPLPAAEAPLGGRKLYFVGIGGSGMSAYANIAQALGAEVRGWDLRDTIFMGSLEGIEVDIGGDPAPPAGWEVVVSTAHLHRIEGMPRADFLAELVAAQPAIVVGGAHGKTTTAAMIAFVLQETGARPGVDHRRDRAAARRQRRRRRRLARGRGRRVRPLDRLAAPPDRGAHEHRARPSRRLRVRGRAARLLRRLARRGAARRPKLGPATRRARARGAGRAQPPERGRGARRARAGRRPAAGGGGRARALHRRRSTARARRRARRRHRLRRLRPQPDRARGDAPHGALPDERQGDRRLPAARGRADAPAPPGARARRSGSPTSRS